MKKYRGSIIALTVLLAGCSAATPGESTVSISESNSLAPESISSSESENLSVSQKNSDENCYTIEEILNGAMDDATDQNGEKIYTKEGLQAYRDSFRNIMDDGYLFEGVGTTFEDSGITFTLQDVWYEKTTDNMQENYYELRSDIKDPIYIYMTLQAENTDTAEHIVYINDGILIAFPKTEIEQGAEMTYQDHVTDPIPNNHDYAVCRLAAGEKETYTIAFEAESAFATYKPLYLKWQCFPKEKFGDVHEVVVKLPMLESR